MMTNMTATMSAALLVAVAVAILLFGDRKSDKILRSRVQAAGPISVRKRAERQTMVLDQPLQLSFTLRALAWLEYKPDLPKGYGAPLKIVLPVAAVVGLVAGKLAAQVLPSMFVPAIGTGVAIFVARTLFVRGSNKYRALLFKQIPDAMSLMLRAVRAGLPIAEAVRSVGRESVSPTREEFTRVTGEAALGMPIELALQRLYERTNLQEYAFFSVVIGLHGQTGGNLSEVLENLADMVRRRVAMAAKARALAAEGKLSAVVVSALPFVVGILICFVNPDYMAEFVSNPKGPMFIVAFAILLTMGVLSTQWLIKKSLQD